MQPVKQTISAAFRHATKSGCSFKHAARTFCVRPEINQSAELTDFGTRPIFSEEHDMFRQTCRRFFQEEVVPHHSEWEKNGQVSREVWEKAGEQGLLGVNTSDEHGGVGGDVLSTAITWEEQMYVNCSGPGFALHSDIVMPYISHYGTPEQIEKFIPAMTAGKKIGAIAMTEPSAGRGLKSSPEPNDFGPGDTMRHAMPYISHYGTPEQIEKFIPAMTAGKKIGAIAMTEPSVGSDLQGIRTNAKKDGDDWILNGSKVFITNGWMADVVIVVAITDAAAKSAAHGISLFLVEDGMKGFIKGKKLQKIGFKAQDTAELFFEDVRLPSSALLGKANQGFYYLMQELPQERLIIADMAQASCEWMFEETRSYVKQRKAFGKTIAKLQTIQHKLAEIKTDVCFGRAFVDNCLKVHNERGLDSESASMAKYWCSDLQNNVATKCLQMHGGWGYMWEYPIARAFVDSRVQPIYGGSNEIMKELIARKIIT